MAQSASESECPTRNVRSVSCCSRSARNAVVAGNEAGCAGGSSRSAAICPRGELGSAWHSTSRSYHQAHHNLLSRIQNRSRRRESPEVVRGSVQNNRLVQVARWRFAVAAVPTDRCVGRGPSSVFASPNDVAETRGGTSTSLASSLITLRQAQAHRGPHPLPSRGRGVLDHCLARFGPSAQPSHLL